MSSLGNYILESLGGEINGTYIFNSRGWFSVGTTTPL